MEERNYVAKSIYRYMLLRYIQYMDGFPFYPQKFLKTNDISRNNILLHSYEYFCLISSLEIFDNAVLPPYCNYH